MMTLCCCYFHVAAGKKSGGKARDESMIDKKHELEKRLENVKGALGAPKKQTKKGSNFRLAHCRHARC